MDVLHVDCATCRARGPECGECVISVLLGPELVGAAPQAVTLDDSEQAALAAMAESGLLPPLRLVRALPPPKWEGVAIRAALP